MGRGATKAAGNVWYEARMEAAKWNDKLLSRAGAAEALNMPCSFPLLDFVDDVQDYIYQPRIPPD